VVAERGFAVFAAVFVSRAKTAAAASRVTVRLGRTRRTPRVRRAAAEALRRRLGETMVARARDPQRA
jgi:hypothetical protein